MKTLILLVVLCNLHNLDFSYGNTHDGSSILLKTYPKKVRPLHMYNVKLINSGRIKKIPGNMKETDKGNEVYTAFPTKLKGNTPDSPYFPLDSGFEPKPRVKKVLDLNIRRKRAATNETKQNVAKVAPVDKISEKKVEKKQVSDIKVASVVKPSEKKVERKQVSDTKVASVVKPSEKKVEKKQVSDIKVASVVKPSEKKVEKKQVSDTKVASVAKPIEKKVEKEPEVATATRKVARQKSGPHRNQSVKQASKVAKKKSGKRISRSGKKGVKSVKSQKSSHNSKLRNKHSQRDGGKSKQVNKPGDKNQKRQLRSNHKHSRNGEHKSKDVASKAPKAGRRLIAARDTAAEDYPYMISIQKGGEHWCAGALLNRRLITTTANCFWKSISVSHMKVRVGTRNTDHGGQVAWIQEVMKHPKWSIRKYPDNDIALALLDRNVKFSHSVHAVDLPNRAMLPPFDDAWVTSFGAERRDGVYDPKGRTMQVYHTRLMDHTVCNNITQRFGAIVTENFICLAQTGRRAPCTRDTGAPAVSDGVLWGLASWGIRKLCGTERFPAIFSYVGSNSNMDFIMNATKFLMSEERENPMWDRMRKILHTSTKEPGHSGHAQDEND